MACQLCKRKVFLPYACSYCGQTFCDDHRLPEKHMCPGLPKRGWSNRRTKVDRRTRREYTTATSERLSRETRERINSMKPKPKSKMDMRITAISILCLVLLLGGIYVISYPEVIEEFKTNQVVSWIEQKMSATYNLEDISLFYVGKIDAMRSTIKCWGWVYGVVGIPFVIPLIPATTEYNIALRGQIFLFVLIFVISSFVLISIRKNRHYRGKLYKIVLSLLTLMFILLPIIVPGIYFEQERLSTNDFSTRDELEAFLKNDHTDSRLYTDEFVCEDFSRMLIERGREAGYRIYFLRILVKNPNRFRSFGEEDYVGHALCRVYIISEDKWVDVEPQTDMVT